MKFHVTRCYAFNAVGVYHVTRLFVEPHTDIASVLTDIFIDKKHMT